MYTFKHGFFKKKSLVFRIVLGSHQNWAEGTEIFHIISVPDTWKIGFKSFCLKNCGEIAQMIVADIFKCCKDKILSLH